jgi:hypothetical protein
LGVEDELGEDEISLLGSVLEFAGKTVGQIMVKGFKPWYNGHADNE